MGICDVVHKFEVLAAVACGGIFIADAAVDADSQHRELFFIRDNVGGGFGVAAACPKVGGSDGDVGAVDGVGRAADGRAIHDVYGAGVGVSAADSQL